MGDETSLSREGYIEHIIFRNEDNGYTVFSLISDGEELTCVGFFQFINEGETVALTGRFEEHYAYGRQFKVTAMEVKVPEDAEAIERYLGSGAIKGIGAVLASRIVKKFGDDTLRIIDEEPERLAEIKGISERKAREIASHVAEQSAMRRAMMFLQKYGLTVALSVKIYKAYGEKLYDVLRDNPYRLAEDIDGVGFKIADEIAGRMGFDRSSEYRIRSGLLYVLLLASQDGHVYLPRQVLTAKGAELLGAPAEQLDKVIDDLAIERKLILKKAGDDVAVYAGSNYYLELNCASRLLRLNVLCDSDEPRIEALLKALKEDRRMELDEEQEKAVALAARRGLMVLTGGPGTGKTTAINEMIRYFEKAGLTFLLAAPTGRAARRMTEATGYEASTIHRLLELGPGAMAEGGDNAYRFGRNEQNPLETDVVIIDEMSMVDISLMNALLMAVADGTRLILVGDADQLPSVGPGEVLCDILKAGVFPTVRLTKIFRQAQGSDIVVNAHAVNAGEQITLDTKSEDFFYLRRSDPEVIIRQMAGFIKGKLPAYAKADPLDIQVLCPMKKGVLGVEHLNEVLQQELNPPDKTKREHAFGTRIFREGDKVMQTKNNYQLEWEVRGRYNIPVDRGVGIFNGDMGIIREINEYASLMIIEFDGVRTVEYPFNLQEELELAYAVTIHKSQGSEYPGVILPLLGGPRMLLTRNLLYTAITRAKNCLVIMGAEETVRTMIDNRLRRRRYTSLAERILELVPEMPSHSTNGLI
ncbi:MAG: ATP-dependent RecD-like DNA helicase [Lachnospiraceae bacterium]|nr:ATP-dependent RecD-like DNA helicase [Lachnospiraceae bacterium]